jgi:hypothetical protein
LRSRKAVDSKMGNGQVRSPMGSLPLTLLDPF